MVCRTAVTASLAAALVLLAGCASAPPAEVPAGNPAALAAWAREVSPPQPPAVLLLGEQHDAPDHPHWQRAAVSTLARDGRLAALALEMADSGTSTAGLAVDASETDVRAALRWDNNAWPWARYAPPVMAAVRAGVPVIGANLPRARLRDAMQNRALDDHLTLDRWQKQQENIRNGHCQLLPEAQIVPMARVQLARDAAMAAAVRAAVVPGRTVLLVAGNQHVDRALGVPTHLGGLTVRSLSLQAGNAGATSADRWWPTAPAPARDHCAELRQRWAPNNR